MPVTGAEARTIDEWREHVVAWRVGDERPAVRREPSPAGWAVRW